MTHPKQPPPLQRSVLEVTLVVASPFLFPGLATQAAGVDVACLRDETGALLLPGDQLRGVIRVALLELKAVSNGAVVTLEEIDAWLGIESMPGVKNEPERANLIFGDLSAPKTERRETVRIKIDGETGAVERGALQVIELAAPFRTPVTFTGEIIAWHTFGHAPRLINALQKAIRMTAAIGAVKSPGFGEIVAEKCSVTGATPTRAGLPLSHAPAPLGQMAYRLTFDRPLLVDAELIDDNMFQGASVVPGGVIKGALARRLKLASINTDSGDWAASLSALSIGQALPEAKDGTTARALPLSLVAVRPKDAVMIGDALDTPIDRGTMLRDQCGKLWPGLFQSDWKYGIETKVRETLKQPRPPEIAVLPRTHTAVSPENIAETAKLFTAIARSHLLANDLSKRQTWHMVVDYSAVADKAHASIMADLIQRGLDFIGKTAAHADIESVVAPPLPRVAPVFNSGGRRFAVVLESPAVLTDATDTRPPQEAYAAYWLKHLPKASMVNFFASQRLAGGYLATRYRAYGAAYYPFVLTMPGSVFLLEGDGLQGELETHFKTGLPVASINGSAPDWTTCPYLPQNGYGRFSADYMSEKALRATLTQGVAHV